MTNNICKLISFNCKNVKRSLHCIRELCKSSDIIALQETWLLPEEITFLNTIDDDFNYTGVSAVDTSAGILSGRPYGGVALLWRRRLFHQVNIIQCNNPRLCAIKIVLNNKSLLVMSVYMPTDMNSNVTDFTDILSSVSAIIENCSVDYVYILGDFNAHPSERFFKELSDFCGEQDWTCIDIELLGQMSDTYTFISESHGSKRWLDHCIVTKATAQSVQNVSVSYDVLWSDHFPLVIECNLNVLTSLRPDINIGHNKVVWGERNAKQINFYTRECNHRLKLIDFPQELYKCCDKTCNISSHLNCIDKIYNEIVHALREAAVLCYNCNKITRRKVVGWNKHVADAHKEARYHFTLWVWHGKPGHGRYYERMCEARKIFKARLRWCQKHENQIKMDILASHHSNNDFRAFWKNTNKLREKPGVPVCVGGVSDPTDIANHFKDLFYVKSPLGTSSAMPKVEPGMPLELSFNAKEMAQLITTMSRGKSPGHDGLSIEHLRYAGVYLPKILSMLYSLCIAHCYLPSEMVRTVVVPVVKNKTGDLADSRNYRPISLATVMSKVLDGVLNAQLGKFIIPHDNQFGFRPGLSTETAVLCVKHAITYYTKRRTPVYGCFLDLSKAFDLVSYDLLWKKLEDAQAPPEVVNILKYWYGNQVNNVRWAGALSCSYKLECGVRQGGLTSPTLFNLYINDLIGELSSTKVGCHIDGVNVNNISYADDMVLLSASICGLRKLIARCEQYAELHGLTYNSVKSELMVFGAGGKYPSLVPTVYLNGTPLQRTFKFKYLGHILTPSLKDDEDIERERRALSVRANMLARRFAHCTLNVKITLFRAYCTAFYTCSLWAAYTQRSYSALRVQYNNAFRVLVGLPRYCSASGMFADARVDCFYSTMRKRCASLVRRVRGSANSILNMISSRLDCTFMGRCCAISHGMLWR